VRPENWDEVAARLLLVLADQQWHLNQELADKVTFRFGSAMQTVRQWGFEVESERVEGRTWRYRMTGKRVKYAPKSHPCPSCTCFAEEG
jgi:biotin operon repressor